MALKSTASTNAILHLIEAKSLRFISNLAKHTKFRKKVLLVKSALYVDFSKWKKTSSKKLDKNQKKFFT